MSASSNRFIPRFRYIIAITNAQFAQVTFSVDHDYTDGEIVSFRVTQPYGMVEINNLQSTVLSHTNDSITVDIDTMSWTPFIFPVAGLNTPPVCVPSASGIIPAYYPPTVTLFDAFDNIRV